MNDTNSTADEYSEDLGWHALNYRTAHMTHAQAMFEDLEACVQRKINAAVAAERERCAAICDEARDAIWPYHEPEVLNAACTVCENLAKRIRGVEA